MEQVKTIIKFAIKVYVAIAVISIAGKLIAKVSPQIGAWVGSPSLIGDTLLS